MIGIGILYIETFWMILRTIYIHRIISVVSKCNILLLSDLIKQLLLQGPIKIFIAQDVNYKVLFYFVPKLSCTI